MDGLALDHRLSRGLSLGKVIDAKLCHASERTKNYSLEHQICSCFNRLDDIRKLSNNLQLARIHANHDLACARRNPVHSTLKVGSIVLAMKTSLVAAVEHVLRRGMRQAMAGPFSFRFDAQAAPRTPGLVMSRVKRGDPAPLEARGRSYRRRVRNCTASSALHTQRPL
jgi:hypothetical protein